MIEYLEQWRDIANYEGVYQVSSLGQVKRIANGNNTWAGRILKHKCNPALGDYPYINLSKNGRVKTHSIHRLVCEAFHGAPPTLGHEVNHKNGNPSDCRADNLEWVTRSQNNLHAVRVLGRVNPMGESHGCARLKATQVREIRRLWSIRKPTSETRYSQADLAKSFGVSQSNISMIVTYKSWKHI